MISPPPAKRPKGNPIITRYPPPPGYKGPAQPQAPFQQPAWQPPPQHQPYGYGQPTYPQQPYPAPQPYQQPQWPAWQGQQLPPNGYAPTQSYYQPPAPSYPIAQQSWPAPSPAPQSAPAAQWQPPGNLNFQRDPKRHNSAPFPHARNGSVGLLDGNGDPFPASVTSEDLEDDYDSECHFARHPDEVDPAFSLGQIEWHAPLPTKLALPATFREAELEALAPRNPPPEGEESISEYFVRGKRDDAFLSVRQTETWDEVKDDIIYRDFPRVCTDLLTMPELLEKYKDRPDLHWNKPRSLPTATPTPDRSRQTTPANGGLSNDVMEIDQFPSSDRGWLDGSSEQGNVLDNLEQALLSSRGSRRQSNAAQAANGAFHSRSVSASSQAAERITRPLALAPVRDSAQEDILAALGVTGSPKVVYQTPGPAFGAPAPQSASNGEAAPVRQISGGFSAGGLKVPPPPPAAGRSPPYGSWKIDDQLTRDSQAHHRPASSHSHHTAAGSDFGGDDHETTPRPQHWQSDNRKRDYDSFYRDSRNGGDDDPTPKQRRTLPGDGDVYGRRW